MQRLTKILDLFNFGALVLLLFSVIFLDKMEVMPVLQWTGRWHLLLLHIPIGAFLMLVLTRWLIQAEAKTEAWKLLTTILCTTSLLAALTGSWHAIGGEFNSPMLDYHAWSAAVFTIVLYAMTMVQRLPLFDGLSIIGVVGLVATGHFGGSLTHGSDFLMPNKKTTAVVAADASTIYGALVQPILEKKCMSCHSKEKTKGGLMLIDTTSIMKGGENGVVVVPGNAAKSKLYSYSLLPLKDEKHMPPDGKVQLTIEEKNILRHWINKGSLFKSKVSEVLPHDSLYTFLPSLNKKTEVKTYAFDAADEDVIASINNPYLSVYPIAKDVPALIARFFVAAQFKKENLLALKKLNKQVVYIDLHHMPVTDDMMAELVSFDQMEVLNLANTHITAAGLTKLQKKNKLSSLILANTKVDKNIESSFVSFPALTHLYLDNTAIDITTIKNWKQKYPALQFYYQDKFQDTIALTPPILVNENRIIGDGEKVSLKCNINGAIIRYTTDGSQPDSNTAMVYKGPFSIQKSSKIRAVAERKGWLKSQETEVMTFKAGIPPGNVSLKHKPNEQYPGLGGKTVLNHTLAPITNFKDTEWLGFKEKPFSGTFNFPQPKKLTSIVISYGMVIGSYIFPPTEARVYGKDGNGKLTLLGKTTLARIQKDYKVANKSEFVEVKVNSNETYREWVVEVDNLTRIPDWHPGKGEKGWLFLDEIFFYE